MLNEVRVLGEVLPTFTATERLFGRVAVEVVQKAFAASVRLPALAALKGHLAGVKPEMDFEAFPAPVRFPALAALKGHLSCVKALMGNQGDVMLEGFAALAAPIRLLPRVHAEMLNEEGFLAEGLPALAALERLFSGVDLPVPIKMRYTSEHFATVSAFAVFLLSGKGLCALTALGCLPNRVSHLMPEETRGSLEDHCIVCTQQGWLSRAQHRLLGHG